ncbi:glycosyltransferase family 4 protein [uncultured Polaribacter sp.]|uniref:glycosyltransferase family 4 protein n=1 Tax=uncultured Polaribacter sp. TaxID=174711 RepID=UPI0026255451|nr:glycosyltransferase [uncultured Polaribacter sp.]
MKQKLSVLFICGWYPSRVSPFNGDFIERHAKAVAKKHLVDVIHIISDKNQKNNIEITAEKGRNLNTQIAYLKSSKNLFLKTFLYLKAFFILLKKIEKIDIIHLNELYPFGIYCLYLKWFKKKQFIISEHWTGYHEPQSKNISVFQKLISKIICKNAAFVCPVSNNLTKSIEHIGLKGTFKRVPNIVETDLFYPIEKPTSTYTITHVSNMLDTHKNVTGFLNVIKQLENEIEHFKVNLIGENSQKYKKHALKLGIKPSIIHFQDQIPYKEVAKVLQNSNLFVLFSNYENLPCVILESFSCGIPVISTNVGGISEFFPEDFGKLIPKKNEQKLKKEIINFYNKKHFVAAKNKMHDYVKANFSEDTVADDFTSLYLKAIKV